MKDAQTMIDAFKGHFLHSRDLSLLSFQSLSTGDGINDDIISKEIIPMIKKLAKKNDLSVIDLHTAMDGMPELFPDRIHPNEKGAQVMAKAVYQSISTLK